MNVGTPHTVWLAGRRLVASWTAAIGAPGGDLVEHDVGVDALRPPAPRGPRPPSLQLPAVVVAEREERLVHVEEAVGELVAHDHAGLQGEQAGVVLPAAPDVGLALGHVDLAERERHEGHVPRRAGSQAGDDVLVGVAGERAAVVPGDGEGAAGRSCPVQRPGSRAGIPRRLATACGQTRRASRPRPTPSAAPTSDVGRVVDLHVDPARGHDGGERVVERPERVALARARRRP